MKLSAGRNYIVSRSYEEENFHFSGFNFQILMFFTNLDKNL